MYAQIMITYYTVYSIVKLVLILNLRELCAGVLLWDQLQI